MPSQAWANSALLATAESGLVGRSGTADSIPSTPFPSSPPRRHRRRVASRQGNPLKGFRIDQFLNLVDVEGDVLRLHFSERVSLWPVLFGRMVRRKSAFSPLPSHPTPSTKNAKNPHCRQYGFRLKQGTQRRIGEGKPENATHTIAQERRSILRMTGVPVEIREGKERSKRVKAV